MGSVYTIYGQDNEEGAQNFRCRCHQNLTIIVKHVTLSVVLHVKLLNALDATCVCCDIAPVEASKYPDHQI